MKYNIFACSKRRWKWVANASELLQNLEYITWADSNIQSHTGVLPVAKGLAYEGRKDL